MTAYRSTAARELPAPGSPAPAERFYGKHRAEHRLYTVGFGKLGHGNNVFNIPSGGILPLFRARSLVPAKIMANREPQSYDVLTETDQHLRSVRKFTSYGEFRSLKKIPRPYPAILPEMESHIKTVREVDTDTRPSASAFQQACPSLPPDGEKHVEQQ